MPKTEKTAKRTGPEANHAVKMAIREASKSYQTRSGAVHALDKVSLDVREGEFLCILGPSGCGKTTLLWSMAGLHTLSSGDIRLGNEPVSYTHLTLPTNREV